jgi:hypothetical protein
MPLNKAFEAEASDVVRQALTAEYPDTTASIVDEFTRRCIHKVLMVLQELLSDCTADKVINRHFLH